MFSAEQDPVSTVSATFLTASRHGSWPMAGQFIVAVAELDPDLGSLVNAWIDADGIPTFRTSVVQAHASRGTAAGGYQYRVHVVNDGPVPGLVSLESVAGDETEQVSHLVEPVVVPGGSAVEIGWSERELAEAVWLLPYLSANREPFRLVVATAATPPDSVLTGSQSSTWRPRDARDGVLIVDDRDTGFSIHREQDHRWRLSDTREDVESGERLAGGDLGGWRRNVLPGSWGRARRSAVWSLAGDGSEKAVFVARIPRPGRWVLAFHIPPIPPVAPLRPSDPSRFEGVAIQHGPTVTPTIGIVKFTIGASDGMRTVQKDLGAAREGWLDIGEFTLDGGDATVSVSNATDGTIVVADALRWTMQG